MSHFTQNPMNSELILKKHKILRICAENEFSIERRRLHDIDVFCRLLSDDNNNSQSIPLSTLSHVTDDMSDLSTIGSSRESSDVTNDRSSSCETLHALCLEERLLSAEVKALNERPETEVDSESEDEDLKEFRQIERELRVAELTKSLNILRKEIQKKSEKRIKSSVAPLAECESICDDSTTHDRDDTRDSSPDDNPDDCRPKPTTRPLTLYLPSNEEELDLEQHIQTLGHELDDKKEEIRVTRFTCFGYLWKLCKNSSNDWRKRFFLFDRKSKLFLYFSNKRQFTRNQPPKGGVAFDAINDVYVDHSRIKTDDNCRQVFVVSSTDRTFVLSTFSPEVMRIWVDVVVTGAQGGLQPYF